jgi:hypothetical protein
MPKTGDLTAKELETYKVLIRLGDSPELAYNTVKNDSINEAMREAAKSFYQIAYEM